jgi:DNA-binding CsgD family transcriptional regulator
LRRSDYPRGQNDWGPSPAHPGELDAAIQAAASRSNRQIATDGHLSVRTVESHLQRVYEKLGISSRRELAGALRYQPVT